jgi:hypothetical protein
VVEFEVSGCPGGGQSAPIALMAEDSILLAATSKGERGEARISKLLAQTAGLLQIRAEKVFCSSKFGKLKVDL